MQHCPADEGQAVAQASNKRHARIASKPIHRVAIRALASGATLAALLAWPLASHADQQTTNGNTPARANLDFKVSINKFIYLRVGAGSNPSGSDSGTGPAANATQDTVSFNVTPSIPGAPTTPVNGSARVRWTGGAPSFISTAVGTATLPVAVRSNAGQVGIAATVSTPLSNGSATIPMSAIGISSSAPGAVPVPLLPATGTGASVNVPLGGPGTATAPSLLTQQTADWTFSYTHNPATPGGSYSGVVMFTATAL